MTSTALVNYIAGAICVSTGKKNNSLQLIAGGKHLKIDTYNTLRIFVGLVLIYFTKFLWLDSAVACLFALIIIYTGNKIVRISVAGIMDEADLKLLNSLVELLNKTGKKTG